MLSIFLPISGNDALQYLIYADLLAEHKTTSIYPVTEPTQRGFYAISSHPLGFIGLHTISMLFSEGKETIFNRIINPFYILYTILLLRVVFFTRPWLYVWLSAFILLSTPLVFIQTYGAAIDIFRIYFLLLATVWVVELAKQPNTSKGVFKYCLMAGLVAGFSMYTHAINLVFTLPLLLPLFFITKFNLHKTTIILSSILVLAAIAISIQRPLENFLTVGSPVSDSVPVYELENLAHKLHIREFRDLYDLPSQIYNGVLKGFTNYRFGFSYWLLVFMIFLYSLSRQFRNWSKPEHTYITASAVIIALFYGAVILSLLLGLDAFIKNSRYLLTIQPFIAILGAIAFGWIYEQLKKTLQ